MMGGFSTVAGMVNLIINIDAIQIGSILKKKKHKQQNRLIIFTF